MTEIFVKGEERFRGRSPQKKTDKQKEKDSVGPWPPPRSIAASKKGHSIHYYIVRVKVSNNKNTPELDFRTTTTTSLIADNNLVLSPLR